jgi:hypothetical protein
VNKAWEFLKHLVIGEEKGKTMAAHDATDAPRNGQYMKTATFVDYEGGGDLEFRVKVCPDCHALVDEEQMDAHQGTHEAIQGGGEQPKSR